MLDIKPGVFNVDVTSPGGAAESLGESLLSGQTFLDQLGDALFKKEGSLLGGIPVVGDIGRFIGDNPVGQFLGTIPRVAINTVGTILERIPSGNKDLTEQYRAKVSPEIQAKYATQIEAESGFAGRAQHLMFGALQEQAYLDQQKNPNLFYDLQTPTGSLADSVGRVLGIFSAGGRAMQRYVAGTPKADGLNRLQWIEAASAAGMELHPEEQLAFDMWKSGAWSPDKALDFLASNESGYSHDRALQTAASFALDPGVWGSVGAVGLTKLGVAGKALVRRTALAGDPSLIAKTGGAAGKFDVLGKIAETDTASDFLRWYGSKVYTPLETSQMGKIAKAVRYAIDPLHAIGQNKVVGEAVLDVISESSVRAFRESVGGQALPQLAYARMFGQGFQDTVLSAEKTYTTNATRRLILRQHRDGLIGLGGGEELSRTPINEVMGELLKLEAAPDLARLAREEMRKVGKVTLTPQELKSTVDEVARLVPAPPDYAPEVRYLWSQLARDSNERTINAFLDALPPPSVDPGIRAFVRQQIEDLDRLGADAVQESIVRRLERGYAEQLSGNLLADFQKMNPDAQAYWHAIAYGHMENDFLKAWQVAVNQPYTGSTNLNRLNPMNRTTLGDRDLEDLVAMLDDPPDMAVMRTEFTGTDDEVLRKYQGAVIRDYQERFPALRYITVSERPADMERTIAHLRLKIDEGGLPHKLTDSELAHMPDAIREWKARYPDRDLGFTPPDDLKWGIDVDPLTGKAFGSYEVWNDHVTHDGNIFRPMSALVYNKAGMALIGEAPGRIVDALENAANTWRRMTSTREIVLNAEQRFVRHAVYGKASKIEGLTIKGGMTEYEARQVFVAVRKAAQIDGHTVRALKEQDLWNRTADLIPPRLVDEGILNSRELRNLVLDGFEGDFSIVGMTQKLTGRAKTVLGLKGNFTGAIAEGTYPDIKFARNPIFQMQEKIEAPIWLVARGIRPVFGSSMNEAQRVAARVNERMAETGVMRAADLIEMAEQSYAVMAGGQAAARGLSRLPNKGVLDGLTNVGMQRRISQLQVERQAVGRIVKEAMEEFTPGVWDDITRDYIRQAGRNMSDNEIAEQYLAEMALANDVHVNNIIRPGQSNADFSRATNSDPFRPENIGELRPIQLDRLAEDLAIQVDELKTITSAKDLKAALSNGTVTWDETAGKHSVARIMRSHGYNPEYIARAKRALEFDYDGFWVQIKGKFDASPAEIRALQNFATRAGKAHGMSPVEFLSQVFKDSVDESARGATVVDNLRGALNVLRAPAEGGTTTDLVDQLAKIFETHLAPSGRELLLEQFGVRAGGLADALRARVASGVPDANADVERLYRQFRVWSEDAVAKGLWADSPAYSKLLEDVLQIPAEGAVPYNMSQQLMLNKIAEGMRLAEEDAFRLLYYKRTRSFLERSLNHPFFGIYPASYMWGKVLPELVRFIAKEPFGLRTGAMAYGLNEVSKSIAIQREWDPEFDKMLDNIGRNSALWLLSYLIPAWPTNVGASVPTWARDIVEQSIENEKRVAKGLPAKEIDLGRTVRRVVEYTSILRPYSQIESGLSGIGGLGELSGKPEEDTKAPVSITLDELMKQPVGAPAGAVAVPTPQQNLEQVLRDSFVDLTKQLNK